MTSLMNLYAKCEWDAEKGIGFSGWDEGEKGVDVTEMVFDEMPERSVISWIVLLWGVLKWEGLESFLIEITSDTFEPESGLRGELVRGPDANVQVQELGSASVSLDPEEGTILDQIIAAGGSQDELRDKFVSDGTNDDLLSPSKSLQTDAPDEVHSVVHSVERRVFIKMAEVALVDETREIEDASDVDKELSHSTENIGSTKSVYKYSLPDESLLSTSLVEPDESTEALD
ncbi:hypothetical protein SASPL_101858 [Salvia splendens]|uniref:Uncharacterized protein n=1 Tax=Salvia splendens TaxID=180675 RepID=A0A8X9ABL2_SALSN|nr:hypothetical protein SASPL_101858 [Salvia splendens]